MKLRRFTPLLFATVVTVCGCAVYPTTRTFYQADPADGTPQNRTSCGYTNTKDSVLRVVQGVEIFISPGTEELPANAVPSLVVQMGFSYPDGMANVVVDSAKIHVEVDGVTLKPEVVSASDRVDRRSKGYYRWISMQLRYPPPSGLTDQVKFVFQPGALQIDGHVVSVAPFRFSRVTKSDVYYGSINC